METIFSNLYNLIINTIDALGIYGPILASILIVAESMIPVLPLFVFITINFIAFGNIIGFIISWLCTILGCMLSYSLVKNNFRKGILKFIKNDGLLDRCLKYIQNLSLSKITVILSIPFTPAFMMNIAAGLANMDFKKFIIAIVISKIFIIIFWGFIGSSLLESLQNPKNIILILIMILIAYLISIIIKKIFDIN